MLISVPAAFALSRMKFWGSATLATGVFLTYLIPETLLFLPLFKMFARVQRVDRHPADQPLVGAADPLSDADGAVRTWIMIGYFASIPKELDEAAMIDGASWIPDADARSSFRSRCPA